MAKYDVNTPEGLKQFLLAEAELDEEDMYTEDGLRQSLLDDCMDNIEFGFMKGYLEA